MIDLKEVNGSFHVVGPQGQEFGSLSSDEQAKSLSWLQSQVNSSDPDRKSEARRILLRLNDISTIEYFVGLLQQGDPQGSYELQSYGGALALAYLIPEIDHGQDKLPYGQVTRLVTPRVGAVRAALSIIKKSAEFPSPTNRWAADREEKLNISLYGTKEQVRGQLLLWWEHNKDSIRAKRYGEAVWLPKEEINMAFLKRTPDPSIPPPPRPSVVSILGKPIASPSHEKISRIGIWVGSLALLSLMIGWFLRKKPIPRP